MKPMSLLCLLFAFTLMFRTVPARTPDDPIRSFADGETVVFLGDSITHNGYYHSYIARFMTTRHPDRATRFVNSGVSGGKTKDALARLQWDVLDYKPGHVFIDLGMNDTNTSHFFALKGDELAAENARLLARFESEMNEIVSKIRAAFPDCEIVLCSASPYDQVGPQERPAAVGKNDAIRAQIPVLRKIAEQFDCRFIDFNTPMLEIDAREKLKNPAFTISSHDRTHPGPVGHMIMAHEILKRMPGEDLVSWVGVSYQNVEVEESENAVVTDMKREGDALSFTVAEKALPWPIDTRPAVSTAPPAIAALSLVPEIAKLNRQILKATRVPDGTYALDIDDERVGTFTSDQLDGGVDLSMVTATPQYKQAQNVARIDAERWEAERRVRGVEWVRARIVTVLGLDWNDRAAVLEAVKAWPSNKDYAESHQRYLDAYIADRDKEDEFKAEVGKLAEQMHVAAQPVPHRYVITRVGE